MKMKMKKRARCLAVDDLQLKETSDDAETLRST